MHPRNIFKDGVKFDNLALKYDFFKPFVIQEKPNKYTLDFEDREAVLALNRALLLEYYNLDVEIPHNFLIPRIPLRVNYILWIEDLLKEFPVNYHSDAKSNVHGLDIGTGPCAIYALLGARMNNWEMYGTDINEDSVKFAIANVKRNKLEDNVKIHCVSAASYFKEISEISSCTFDFSMCNPPFFSDTKDIQVREDPPSWENKSEVPQEIICAGGEVNFVWKMIEESRNHPVVRIFSTMIGVKKHLTTIIKRMKESGLNNFTTCIFHQGRTSRWGLAWSWDNSVKLTGISQKDKGKPAIFSHKFEKIKSFQEFMGNLENILKDLKMKVDRISKDTLHVEAPTNTWSHSRRKRRLELRAATVTRNVESLQNRATDDLTASISESRESKAPRLDTPVENETATERNGNSNVCQHDEVESKLEGSSDQPSCTDTIKSSANCLTFQVVADRDGDGVILHMQYIQGSLGKDGVHQVLQFLKNKFS